jgi:hypothetical protein
VYAEPIGFVEGQKYDIEKSESESIKMLSSVAKEAGVWVLGGQSVKVLAVIRWTLLSCGRIYSREGYGWQDIQYCYSVLSSGELSSVAKLHMIP